jgi:hypothetical protein
MKKPRVDRHLSLVKNPVPQKLGNTQKPAQGSLFPSDQPLLVSIINMAVILEDTFIDSFYRLHPSQVFDLRTVPSFSIGRLNRTTVFNLFKKLKSKYHDIPGALKITSRGECQQEKGKIYNMIVDKVKQINTPAISIMILLDDESFINEASSHLPDVLPAKGRKKWSAQIISNNQSFFHVQPA